MSIRFLSNPFPDTTPFAFTGLGTGTSSTILCPVQVAFVCLFVHLSVQPYVLFYFILFLLGLFVCVFLYRSFCLLS